MDARLDRIPRGFGLHKFVQGVDARNINRGVEQSQTLVGMVNQWRTMMLSWEDPVRVYCRYLTGDIYHIGC